MPFDVTSITWQQALLTLIGLRVVTTMLGKIPKLRQSRHNLPHASPGRTQPSAKYFPQYFQNRKGLWLYWRWWSVHLPKEYREKPRGVVIAVQGLGDHGDRYEVIGREFNRRGFVVITMDQQGSGLSEGERKYVEDFEDFVDDITDFSQWVLQERLPEFAAAPRYILGHSMGGLITTRVMQRDHGPKGKKFFNGAVLSCAALAVDPKAAPPWTRKVAVVLSNAFPKLWMPGPDSVPFTNNVQHQELAEQDPLNLFLTLPGLTARFGAGFLKAIDDAKEGAPSSTFPVLAMHGAKDTVCMPQGSIDFIEKSGASNKSCRLFENAKHDLVHDEETCDDFFDGCVKFYTGL